MNYLCYSLNPGDKDTRQRFVSLVLSDKYTLQYENTFLLNISVIVPGLWDVFRDELASHGVKMLQVE